jgi:type I restriction-modification system DNA methylase subunit
VARKKLVDAIKAREKQVARAVKELQKLQEERDAREQEIKLAAEREINHLHEASADMLRIAGSEDEARRYFTVVGTDEIAENEFNLNLPRYVDTFEPEKGAAAQRRRKAAEVSDRSCGSCTSSPCKSFSPASEEAPDADAPPSDHPWATSQRTGMPNH